MQLPNSKPEIRYNKGGKALIMWEIPVSVALFN